MCSMVSNSMSPSSLSREFPSREEDWQTLIAWDGEIYDPLFQGDVGYTADEFKPAFAASLRTAESVASDQPHEPELATSADAHSSFEYAFSAPPSVVEGLGSFGQEHPWLDASPVTTSTSPLVRDRPNFDSFEEILSPLQTSNKQFLSDVQSCDSSGSYQTAAPPILNPYLPGSPHSFSGRDVTASQAFSNLGSWVESSFEPIQELEREGAIPIPIPQGRLGGSNNAFSPRLQTQELPQQPSRSRAITIPHSHRSRPMNSQQWDHWVPPVLSPSPEAKRFPRSVPLMRSTSRSERKPRSRMTTPSPTSSAFTWVSYKPNATHRLVPNVSRERRHRGRVGALNPEQRAGAALMRKFGSCSNCKKRKEKCDQGTPCKACLNYYKGDLINHPCRARLLSDLSSAFLAERLGWHPTSRPLDSFVSSDSYHISTGFTYFVPLSFGFGPALHVHVHALRVEKVESLCHEHVIYSWPPDSTPPDVHNNAVLPAVLTKEAETSLKQTLDDHLSLLVKHHFRYFPLFCSPLYILKDVYVFYRSLPVNTPYSRLLHQALKLLVLVHVGGDITLPHPSNDLVLYELVTTTMSHIGLDDSVTPTPCFIRSQFGAIMPSLALSLMKEVLLILEQLFLTRECQEWPVALAALIVVVMTVESIQYHAAKLPYHHSYDEATPSSKLQQDSKVDDDAVKSLLAFYSACFPGCHARLHPDWEGEAPFGASAEDKFIQGVREAMKKARSDGYLERKAGEAMRSGDDMGFYFDRYVARLLVMKL